MAIVLDGTTGITTPGLTNTGTETIVNLTTSGNTTLGDASTDTILMTGAPSIGGAGYGMGMGFRNRIINGAMVIDQRNAGASVSIQTTTGYTLDRWYANASQNSKFTVQQNAGSVTPPAGFTYYLGATSSSAYSITASDLFYVSQFIEGYNSADLAWGTASASSVTLSFRVYSSLTGTFGGSLQNSANTRSYPFTYSIPTANTWTTISVTVAGDTSGTWLTTNGIGIRVFLGLGVGSTYSGTAGAWAGADYRSATGATSVVGTNGATFYITGVQLEKGSTATSFDYRSYGTELQLCQRYYEETKNAGSVEFQIQAITNGLTTTRFAVRKRAIPTVTTFSNVTGVAGTVNNGNGNVQTASSGTGAYVDCFYIIVAGTTSQMYLYNWTASAEL